MNRHLWLGLLALPGLVGCTPPGPIEYYRSATQARNEFVDSLSRVVDEKSAKEKFKVSEKQLNERLRDIKEGLDRIKYDTTFRKLGGDKSDISPDDRNAMIEGLKAYLRYCQDVAKMNVRIKRERLRLQMVANLELLAKAQSQLANNQKVSVSQAADCPNLSEMFTSLGKLNETSLSYVQTGVVTKEGLGKLKSGLSDNDLKEILEFEPQNLEVKVPGIEAPPLPPYPQWAIEVDRRANLGLTNQPAGKR